MAITRRNKAHRIPVPQPLHLITIPWFSIIFFCYQNDITTMENNIRWLIIGMGETFYVSYIAFNFILPYALSYAPVHIPLTPEQQKQLTHDYVTKINSS
jgi:hypothetical protein